MKLKDKVALITGSSDGIGKAIALKFAEEGASVVITYHKEENKNKAIELKKIIEDKGREVLIVQLDLMSVENIKKVINDIIEKFDRIDILVNNAGFYNREKFFDENEESWDKNIDTNLKGGFFCSKIIGKQMFDNKSGKIINISSNAIRKLNKDRGISYLISKVGIEYFTKSLSIILAPYVNVNCIAPGNTLTKMSLASSNKEIKRELEEKVPLKRLNNPEDIANCVLFLASEDSRNITGEIINVDGGDSLINDR